MINRTIKRANLAKTKSLIHRMKETMAAVESDSESFGSEEQRITFYRNCIQRPLECLITPECDVFHRFIRNTVEQFLNGEQSLWLSTGRLTGTPDSLFVEFYFADTSNARQLNAGLLCDINTDRYTLTDEKGNGDPHFQGDSLSSESLHALKCFLVAIYENLTDTETGASGVGSDDRLEFVWYPRHVDIALFSANLDYLQQRTEAILAR